MRRAILTAIIFVLPGLSLVGLLASLPPRDAKAFPLSSDQTTLPAGTDLNEDSVDRPREIFHSEVLLFQSGAPQLRSEAPISSRSYMVNLGDLAFNSSVILGGPARRAGMSCGTCHVNGANNGKLYVPGSSSRPGTFDPTGPLFNPKADNHVLDAVRIPSLRGARYLAPYGNDGRITSLREFVRNVIVKEFDGPEPSPTILDAIVSYIEDIDFLPNSYLGADGRLGARANDAQRRGETLFFKPFPNNPELSCAGCHIPSSGFVDHRQHSVGSGGLFKTPTLINANFNAPYFHDGRYDTFEQVIDHFARTYKLELSTQDKTDLAAYLQAVGDGLMPYDRDAAEGQLKEINNFASVLDTAIPAHDNEVIALAVDTVDRELRDLAEHFPGAKDTTVAAGLEERLATRKQLKNLVLITRRIGLAAAEGHFDEATAEYRNFRSQSFFGSLPITLRIATPWSLFNPDIHDAHFAELRQLLQSARKLPER